MNVDIDIEEALRYANNHEVLDLIKAIDGIRADWSFTLDLYEHFAALKREHEKEEAEDAANAAARRLAAISAEVAAKEAAKAKS